MDQLERAEEALTAARNDHESAYAAEVKKLDDVKKKLLKRRHDLNEKKRQCAADYGGDHVSDDDLIDVNAGGKIVTARCGVLCQLKSTRLDALFSGRWDKKMLRDSSGRIFLDVNPKAFRAIVDYLNELVISAEDEELLPPWKDGAKLTHFYTYFGLRDDFFDSNIMEQSSHLNTIHQWLREEGSDGDLKLIYRSSRDGLSNEMFHDKCDNMGPTLIVLETGEGHVVGGYSNTPWQSSGGYMTAGNAFLFALRGFDISDPVKMELVDPTDYAIEGNSGYGPIFGDEENSDTLLITSDSRLHLNSVTGTYENVPWKRSRDYMIKEMEVYQVTDVTEKQRCLTFTKKQPKVDQFTKKTNEATVDQFTKEVNDAINEKWQALRALEEEVASLEVSFEDEELFIESLTGGSKKDIVTLNVSGTVMATKRATLMVADDSVLAQQFDDTKWTEQHRNLQVKEWDTAEVCNWVKIIEGLQEDVSNIFETNGINGSELLALDKDGLKMLGVDRVGTICLIFDEIKSLKEKVNQDSVTFIEHSPYCFGKILDYLRLKRLQSIDLAEEPAFPTVCESQQKRFEKVVKYYFPGESSSFILGPSKEH